MLQHSGSFKTRGAFANLLLRKPPAAGVVAASGGNHGVAVAYAAQRLGVRATIFVPDIISPAKAERIRGYGANLVIAGSRIADALAAGAAHVENSGAMQVHPFDQAETILGQGSLGMELEQDASDIDTLLVPVGGGGLIGGLATWFSGRVRIIAVEPEQAPTLHTALARGMPVDAPAGGVAGDSLAPRRVGPADVSDCASECRQGCWSAKMRSGRRGPHCGTRFAWWPSRERRPRSRRCYHGNIARRPESASPWCSPAPTPRR